MRKLRIKLFIGSTVEEIETSVSNWLLKDSVCPGNLVDSILYKHGSVYQFVVWFAEFIPPAT